MGGIARQDGSWGKASSFNKEDHAMGKIEMIVFAVLTGLIPSMIAKKKGRDPILWWLYGTFLFIVALPHALIMSPFESKDFKKCPYCAELVKREALICKHCGQKIAGSEVKEKILKDYADGKITKEEFDERKKNLADSPPKYKRNLILIVGLAILLAITVIGAMLP
jgi:ribosomal protein L37AE/L43A